MVWITKYRYQVLQGDLQLRCRDILPQACNSLDIRILKGVVSKAHIRLHPSSPPQLIISETVRLLKGRSSRMPLQEFPELKSRYRGSRFWGIGHGCWSTGHITEDMPESYLSYHADNPNSDEDFILE
ncbi:hypothetical protein EZS27_013171 [termite gut metagenome]|uniref:Transposase IS200-like domain-containing protein n=1 Tax=termite gut metagenome TaxID=433724 RepID=A0A5J4S0C9_9ZZZZ